MQFEQSHLFRITKDKTHEKMEKYEQLDGYSHYEIYKDGTIIRKEHTNGRGIHLSRAKLSHTKDRSGYVTVSLVNDLGKSTKWYVHRLLWTAFVGEIGIRMEIDHIDGNRSNNSLDNLRIVTSKENSNTEITRESYRKSNALSMGKYDRQRLAKSKTEAYEENAKSTYASLLVQHGEVKVMHFMRKAHIGFRRAKRIMREMGQGQGLKV